MILNELTYGKFFFEISDYVLLKVTGSHAESFLQGQLSNDLKILKDNRAQLNCRLTLKGKIHSFFSLGKYQSDIYIFISKSWVDSLLDDLNRYIISEDIQFDVVREGCFVIVVGSEALSRDSDIPVYFLGFQGKILSETKGDYELCSRDDFRRAIMYTGFPVWGQSVTGDDFINETILSKYGISYNKGCFFGQEVPAKINSGRGGNYFPCLLEISEPCGDISSRNISVEGKQVGLVFDTDKNILYGKLKRSHRVLDKEFSFDIDGRTFKGRLKKFPAFGWMSDEELSRSLFLKGTDLYNKQNDPHGAIRLFELAIKADSRNADAYEALGVIYGHQEMYDDAIKLMKMLHEVDPNSIMSHANLSLFYMKKGDIKKAEEEKAKATILGMKLMSKKRRHQREQEKEQEDRLVKNMKMYQEVIALDPEDFFALYKLADVYLQKSDFKQAIDYVQQALTFNSKYSPSYLLLGKALEHLNRSTEALRVYREGAKVAASKGDNSVADEILERLEGLTIDC